MYIVRLEIAVDDACFVGCIKALGHLDEQIENVAQRQGLQRDAVSQRLAVDVFPTEPYPRLAAGAAVPGVIFTPHAAGYTRDLGERVARGVVEALTAWTTGDDVPYRIA